MTKQMPWAVARGISIKKRISMTLFITSSPFVDGADRAILDPQNSLLMRLQQVLPQYPRCLYICSSPDRHDLNCRFGAGVFQIFAQVGMPFASYWVLDRENIADAPKLVEESDLIVLAGGHVPTQNAFFHEARLPQLLKNYPGVILGISAGSMNMADVVYSQPEEPGESAPNFQRFLPGLALTDVNILPHYQKVKDWMLDGLRLFEDITYSDSRGKKFLALPDGSYVYQTENTKILCGEGYLIQDGRIRPLTKKDQELDLYLL